MNSLVDVRACVIVPNWNGLDSLADCLDSLQAQSLKSHIIVVDNGSTDGSAEMVAEKYPDIELIRHNKNRGYAGGVNPGFERAIAMDLAYAAPFNNDAVADKNWLEELVKYLDQHSKVGIACCKLLGSDGKTIDSTGDYYTVWGLPYPRGRGETDINKYDDGTEIFGASGGASLYRVDMLKDVGFFDERFFAYYEDVDLSFRAQLYGWKVAYVPSALAYHQIGATSSKIRGFTSYQTLKNLPLLFWKNVPRSLLIYIWPRLAIAWGFIALRALSRGHIWSFSKALAMNALLWPKALIDRGYIQNESKVSDEYILSIMVHDLPPNAQALRKLRSIWWKLKGRHE